MSVEVINISDLEVEKLLGFQEGHFGDIKGKNFAPAKLTKHLSAFANADGGEILVGIENMPRSWRGFADQEEANGLIQTLELFFPLGCDFSYYFLENSKQNGLVLTNRS